MSTDKHSETPFTNEKKKSIYADLPSYHLLREKNMQLPSPTDSNWKHFYAERLDRMYWCAARYKTRKTESSAVKDACGHWRATQSQILSLDWHVHQAVNGLVGNSRNIGQRVALVESISSTLHELQGTTTTTPNLDSDV
jgi:hypothetical protein